MNQALPNTRALLAFALKFTLYLAVLAPLWWLLIPHYGWLLVQGCGSLLKFGLGMPILAGRIDPQGVLNTGSLLVFNLEGHDATMKIGVLVTNLPPYLALVLATPGLTWKRRLAVLAIGSAILMLFHAAFIIVMLRFGGQLHAAAEIPTAVSQFFLTLPFLLWIVLAYWKSGIARGPKDPLDPKQPLDA